MKHRVCAFSETDDEMRTAWRMNWNDGSRLHLARCIFLEHSECSNTWDNAEQCRGRLGGRPRTVAREPLREAIMRSGRVSKAVAGRNDEARHDLGGSEQLGKSMLDVCCVLTSYDVYIAMVKTGNEGQLSAFKFLLGKFALVAYCAEVSFQPSFLHVVDVDSTPNHRAHWCSAVCSQRAARHIHHAKTRGSSRQGLTANCIVIFVLLKIVLSSGAFHVSSLAVIFALLHIHFLFFN